MNVRWTERASNDAIAIYDYIADRSETYAERRHLYYPCWSANWTVIKVHNHFASLVSYWHLLVVDLACNTCHDAIVLAPG